MKGGDILSARPILIIGQPASGKTSSLMTLNPAETFIIDSDMKGLNWRGWRKTYNKDKMNFVQTVEPKVINNIFNKVNSEEKFKHIKTLVLDGLSTIMIEDEMERMKEKGFDKWTDLAQCIYGIVSKIKDMRDDLTVVFIGHSQVDHDETGYIFTKLKTSGRKLDKIVLESKFNVVLLTRCVNGEYFFETQSNNSTARSPRDCFDFKIPNDLNFVINTLKKYEEE